jgi:hypothetical protein
MDSVRSRGTAPGWPAMAWASVALAALVAKAEADAVIQGVTPSGQYTASTVYGPGRLTVTSTLSAWTQASHHFGDLWLWLVVQAGFDVVLIAGYVGLSVALIAGAGLGGGAGRWSGLRRWWPLVGLAAANLVQAALSEVAFVFWIRPQHKVPAVLAGSLEGAVIAKWLLAIVFVAVLAYLMATSPEVRKQFARIAVALKKQRFSLVIVALLAVIAIARGMDVLEQMPDVQRAWLTWPPSLGWAHLAFAVLAQVLLAALLALLSALRTQRARASRKPVDNRDAPGYLPWVLTALALPVLALIMRYTNTAAVSWYNVIPIPAAAGAVVGISVVTSWWTRRARREHPAAEPAPASEPGLAVVPDEEQRADITVRTTGDMLAVAVIAVTGLGLVRSFTAAAMVVGRPYSWAFSVAVAAGFVVAALSWVLARGRLQKLAAGFDEQYHSTGWNRQRTGLSLQPEGDTGGLRSPAPWLAFFAIPFAIADVLLIFLPLWTTHWLGVLGTTVIALGTLAVGLAVLAYLAQSRKPLPVFGQLLRLKSTPVISLILIVAIASAVIGATSQLHDIRLPPAVATSAGSGSTTQASSVPTLADSLQQWLTDPATASCAVPVPAAAADVRVEPMVLVAAAGGGIRAAWWTLQALKKLAATPCGQHAVFAASSVSGSSLGLAIMDTTNDRGGALARIAGPDALAAAIDGLLLRDTIAGLTGLDVTAASMRPAAQRFPDRAALLEHAWENEDPALAEPFPLTRPLLPWRLLLNSTAVSTGCRAIMDDRPIAPAPASPATSAPTCALGSAGPVPDSYDFFARLPCLRGIDTATAALLSARFPYVTPSGAVNGCGTKARTQIEQYVDGGYADSTGVATLAGLAPELMTAVRQYNAKALASAASGQPVTLVAPVAVYLGNSPQLEPAIGAPAGSPPQPLIPVQSGAASAHGQLSASTALLQQLATAMSTGQWLLPCAANDPQCPAEQNAAASAVQRLIVVVPREFPAVSTPLGWVLSAASRSTLTSGVTTEADASCPEPAQNVPFCPPGVGRLGNLLQLIKR